MDSSRHYPVSSCFSDYSLWPCISASVLLALFSITLLVTLTILMAILLNSKRWWGHQQVILALAAIEMLIGVLRYVAFSWHGLAISLSYFKLLQLCAICFFFFHSVLRSWGKEHFVKWVVWPITILVITYLTVILALTIAGLLEFFDECQDPAWLIFSASGFVLTCMFLICTLVILRKLNKAMVVSPRYKKRSKYQLWSLSIAWFFTTLGAMIYDIFLMSSSSGGDECDLYLKDLPVVDSLVHIFIRWFELVLPVWAVCYAFRRTKDITRRRVDETAFSHLRADESSFEERTRSDAFNIRRASSNQQAALGAGEYSLVEQTYTDGELGSYQSYITTPVSLSLAVDSPVGTLH